MAGAMKKRREYSYPFEGVIEIDENRSLKSLVDELADIAEKYAVLQDPEYSYKECSSSYVAALTDVINKKFEREG